MHRTCLIALLLLFPIFAGAQSDVIDSMNAASFWKSISFSDERNGTACEPAADWSIVVASNRVPQPGQVRFMSEERAGGELSYFIVYVKDGRWYVRRTSLADAVRRLPHPDRDWVVYTEGYGKIFTNGLYRGLALSAQHDVNVLYLDYPSYNTSKKLLGNYYFALGNARQAGNDFVPVLDSVRRLRSEGQMGTGRMTLFFHSMGNNALRDIVRHDRLDELNDRRWVDNLILNSACVPERGHAAWIDRIRFARHIYIHYNPKDYTLAGANLVSLRRQLGQGAVGPASSSAIYVNFYKICGRNHSNFLALPSHRPASPVALAYYNTLFHGNEVDMNNTENFIPSTYSSGGGYDIICTRPDAMRIIPATVQETVPERTDRPRETSMLSH